LAYKLRIPETGKLSRSILPAKFNRLHYDVISLVKTENLQFFFLVSTPSWNNFLGKYNRQKIKYFISRRKDENIAGQKMQVPYRNIFRKFNIPPFSSAYLHSGTSFVTYLTPSNLQRFDPEQKNLVFIKQAHKDDKCSVI